MNQALPTRIPDLLLEQKPVLSAAPTAARKRSRIHLSRHMQVSVLIVGIAFAAGTAHAVTFESMSSNTAPADSTSLSIALPAGTADGDLLVAAIAGADKKIGTISPPAGWTQIDQGANKAQLGIFYKVASSETGPYLFTYSAHDKGLTAGAILRYSGIDANSPLASGATADTGKSTSPTAPANSTTKPDTMVLRVFTQKDGKNNATPPGGHTERVDLNNSDKVMLGVADVPQPLAGATAAASFTVTQNSDWRAVTFLLKDYVPPADIEVDSKTVAVTGGSSLPIDEGDNIQYVVSVTNNGPNDAPYVTVSDPLPDGISFVSAVPSQGTYDDVSGNWDIGTLADLGTVTLTINATVDAGNSGRTIINTAESQFDNDTDDGNNSQSVSFQVPGSDLVVTKSSSPSGVAQGDQTTFTVTVTNNGPDNEAADIVVEDKLRNAFEFVSSSATQGSYDDTTGDWTIPGGLTSGSSATLTVVVKVSLKFLVAGPQKNSACITSTHDDDVDDNDCGSVSVTITSSNFDIGACIIDMSADADDDGVQTFSEGLKPYGLMYNLLKEHNIPIHWIIDSEKSSESGIDVTINGIDYRHGPFVIDAAYVDQVIDDPNAGDTVRDKLASWATSYPGFTYRCDLPPFPAPVFDTLSVWPLGVLDTDNGAIAEAYYINAGFPPISGSTDDYAVHGRPRDLSSCHDIYIMPHADPHTNWLDNETGVFADGSTGTVFDTIKILKFLERGGQFWAACHAVSAMERLVDVPPQSDWDDAGETPLPEALPGQTPKGLFFLTDNGLVDWNSHADALGPFTLDDSTASIPMMQYMGNIKLAQATLGGSERVYLPDDSGSNSSDWRPTTTEIAIYDPHQTDLKINGGSLSDGKAAIVAYGPAYGNTEYGMVLYEAGHNHNQGKGDGTGDVAAQRVLLNLHFLTGILRRPEIEGRITAVEIERTEIDGVSAELTVTGVEDGDTFNYTWYDTDCGGTFDPQGAPTTIWTPDPAQVTNTESLSCVIGVSVGDICNRANFSSFPLKVLAYDIGDAPASYDESDTARHAIWADAPYLGATAPDVEDSDVGWSGTGANGDDTDVALNDEDGVTFSYPAGTGEIRATVTASNPNAYEDAKLCGYLDGGNTSPFAMDGVFFRDGSAIDEEECVTVPAGTTNGAYELAWTWNASAEVTTFGRFRITTDPEYFLGASPSPTGPAKDGEIEDHPITISPTAVTIGRVELDAVDCRDFMASLNVEQMTLAELLALLTAWDPDQAALLADADRETLLQALIDYLDPDGDGRLAVLSWDTLEERGTIGFFVQRKEAGNRGDSGWKLISNDMLPGLITAPLGGEYRLVDPTAEPGRSYQYLLIEQEASGNRQTYGPYYLELKKESRDVYSP